MNRRRFLDLLGTAALASGVVYSFPSIIVPKKIATESNIPTGLSGLIKQGYCIAGYGDSVWLLPSPVTGVLYGFVGSVTSNGLH